MQTKLGMREKPQFYSTIEMRAIDRAFLVCLLILCSKAVTYIVLAFRPEIILPFTILYV